MRGTVDTNIKQSLPVGKKNIVKVKEELPSG